MTQKYKIGSQKQSQSKQKEATDKSQMGPPNTPSQIKVTKKGKVNKSLHDFSPHHGSYSSVECTVTNCTWK